MEQLGPWIPSIAGAAVIIGTLFSAHWIVSRPTRNPKTEGRAEQTQFPF